MNQSRDSQADPSRQQQPNDPSQRQDQPQRQTPTPEQGGQGQSPQKREQERRGGDPTEPMKHVKDQDKQKQPGRQG